VTVKPQARTPLWHTAGKVSTSRGWVVMHRGYTRIQMKKLKGLKAKLNVGMTRRNSGQGSGQHSSRAQPGAAWAFINYFRVTTVRGSMKQLMGLATAGVYAAYS